jgi:uncharacterized phage protein gp47/JayE
VADPTLDDLLSAETEDSALTFLFTQLSSLKYPVTSWNPGGRAYTKLKAFARAIANISTSIKTITEGGLLSLSTGDWLTLLASEWYSIERNLATFAKGKIAITVGAGAGPYTISPNQLIVFETATTRRFISTNTVSFDLPAGPSVTSVEFQAESSGSAYNAPIGSALDFATPLPGVTAAFQDLGSGSWLTQNGTDDEADETLRERCRTKWALLGINKPADAYAYLALNTPGVGTPVSKTYIDDSNPRGPGTIDIYIASNAGPLPTADETLVRNYIISLQSPTADVEVNNATTQGVTITVTIYFRGTFATTVTAAASDAVRTLIQNLPIGGTMYISQLLEDLMGIDGVVNIPLSTLIINGLNADLVLDVNEVAVFTSLTVTPVLLT